MLVCILQNLIIFVSISLTVKIKIMVSNWGPQCEMTDSRLGDVLVSYWFFNKKETWHMRLISEVFLPARYTVLTAVMWVKETLVTSPHSPVVDSGERACWRWQGGSQWDHSDITSCDITSSLQGWCPGCESIEPWWRLWPRRAASSTCWPLPPHLQRERQKK